MSPAYYPAFSRGKSVSYFRRVGMGRPNEAGLGEREPGGLEDFSDRIYGESQSLKRMGAEEGQAVIAAGEDQGEGPAIAMVNLDPCGRLVSSRAVSQDHGDLLVRIDSETA